MNQDQIAQLMALRFYATYFNYEGNKPPVITDGGQLARDVLDAQITGREPKPMIFNEISQAFSNLLANLDRMRHRIDFLEGRIGADEYEKGADETIHNSPSILLEQRLGILLQVLQVNSPEHLRCLFNCSEEQAAELYERYSQASGVKNGSPSYADYIKYVLGPFCEHELY